MKNKPIRKVNNFSFGRAQYSPSIGAYFHIVQLQDEILLRKGIVK
jgi:hypothetical protein